MSDLDYQQAYRRHRGQASRAATRRAGRSQDDRDALAAAIAAERACPDTPLGKRQIASSLRWSCIALCSDETWDAFGRQLTEISNLTLARYTAAYRSLHAYLVEHGCQATVEGMLAAFRAGAAGE